MKESNSTTTHTILADPFASEEQWLPLCTTAIEQKWFPNISSDNSLGDSLVAGIVGILYSAWALSLLASLQLFLIPIHSLFANACLLYVLGNRHKVQTTFWRVFTISLAATSFLLSFFSMLVKNSL